MNTNNEKLPDVSTSPIQIYPDLYRSLATLKDPLQILAFGACVAAGSLFMPDSQRNWILAGGLFFLVSAAPWFYLEFYRFATFGPHLVLTEQGVCDRRGNFGPIDWDEIRSISIDSELIRIRSSKISIAKRFTKALSKITMECDYEGEFIGYAMHIHLKPLSADPAKIWSFIVEQCKKRGLECSNECCIASGPRVPPR